MKQGNKRFWDGFDKDVAVRIWKALNRLGIVGEGEEDGLLEVIRGLEARDNVGKKVREAKIKKVQ